MTVTEKSGAGASKPLDLAKEFPVPALAAWREAAQKELKETPLDKLTWQTPEGIAVEPIYTRENATLADAAKALPGFAPYRRGTNPLSGVSPAWQVRQDCVLGAPEEVNAALRDGLARGQTAIGIRLDNAARLGYDGDSMGAIDLVGRGGCTLSSINGLRIALQDIDLEKYPITIRTGTAALPVLAMLIALADERGVSRRLLTGAVEGDPVRELAKVGSLRGPLDLHFRELADMAIFCQRECPGIRPIIVNSHVFHNAGASAVQELAATLASGVEYLRALEARGLDARGAALSMVFSFSVSTNLYPEIAKLRAARQLWATIVKAFGVTDLEAQKLFLHVKTSTYTKTVNDPYNNMVRTVIESFAGAVGGADSMYVAPFNEPIGRPDEFAARMARNQQLILREEAFVGRVVDPAGGSFYIETLTDSIAAEAWKLFQEIEAKGGLVKSMEAGFLQKKINDTAERKRQAIATRRQPIVGVSNYPDTKEKAQEKSHHSHAEFLQERQRRVARLRAQRRSGRVRTLLLNVTRAVASNEGNLMDIAVEVAREGGTLGEITQALIRGAQGEPPRVEALKSERASAPYEALRARASRHEALVGDKPRVVLVPFGPGAMRRARAEFCSGFFGAGGFQVVEVPGKATAAEVVAAVAATNARLFVLCSDDASYPEATPILVEKIRAIHPDAIIYIAGYPKDSIEQLQAAGAAGFVHIRAGLPETLTAIMNQIGITS